MFRPWLDDSGRRELTEAVSYVESVSAVELVVSVRGRAGSWPHVGIVTGLIAAWVALAFMLFSAPVFPLWSFLVDPFVIGVVAGWVAHRSLAPIRWLIPAAARRAAVDGAASAAFVARRVHGTRGRTGVLIYCALAERMTAIIADTGVAAAVAPERIAAWRDQIERAVSSGAPATAAAIAAMAPVFAAAAPRMADDVNELADAVEQDVEGSSRA
jgi:putative membrane protein